MVFRTSLEAPVLSAMEISKQLKNLPEFQVRMGSTAVSKASRFGDGRYLVVGRAEPVFVFLVRACPTCTTRPRITYD